MPVPILLREDTGAVATLTLNTPGNLNALSDAMIAALTEELGSIAAGSDVRAVILRGSGKAFCAGHDLKEMTAGRQAEDGGKAYFADLFKRCAALMTLIPSMPQPKYWLPSALLFRASNSPRVTTPASRSSLALAMSPEGSDEAAGR